MAPPWPFKKKDTVAELDEAPPSPMVYKRGEDPHARPEVTSDQAAYKDALALFGGGSQTVEAASDQSVHYDGVTGEAEANTVQPTPAPSEDATPSHPPAEPAFTWVHHTDGYHYKRNADGSFEPTPHTLQSDGTYVPYS
jgi:hypothetical protein